MSFRTLDQTQTIDLYFFTKSKAFYSFTRKFSTTRMYLHLSLSFFNVAVSNTAMSFEVSV